MRMKKRLVGVILALILLAGLFLTGSLAEVPKYTLTISSNVPKDGEVSFNGTFWSTSDYIRVKEKTEVTVYARPKHNTGYEFEAWYSGKIKLSENPAYTFEMPEGNLELEARFKDRNGNYIFSVKADNLSYGSVSGKVIRLGENHNFTGNHHREDMYYLSKYEVKANVADSDSTFVGWYDGSGQLVTENTEVKGDIRKDTYLTAKFTKSQEGDVVISPRYADYDTSEEGYQPHTPRVFKITNNTASKVTIKGINGAPDYNVQFQMINGSPVTLPYELDSNKDIYCAVAPTTGLRAGTYNENLLIIYEGSEEKSLQANLSFKVKNKTAQTVRVTYYVVNGTWEDGTDTPLYEYVVPGGPLISIPTGMKPSNTDGHYIGSWNPDPYTAEIKEQTNFTYTFGQVVLSDEYTVEVIADPENGGIVSGGRSVAPGDSVKVTASANSGYEFDKWCDEEGYTVSWSEEYEIPSVDTNITLTAKFIKVWKVTLDMNGGTFLGEKSQTQFLKDGHTEGLPDKHIMEEWLNENDWITGPENSEYIGAEVTDKTGTKKYNPGEEVTVTSDTIVKVLWKSADTDTMHKVTFVDGSSELYVQEVKDGGNAVKPADPKKAGNRFKGWYKDAGLEETFDFGTKITENTTVYAGFEKADDNNGDGENDSSIFHTVTFADGDKELFTRKVKDGENVSRPDDPDKEGYTFKGWYKDAGIKVIFEFSTAITEDTTIYAGFEKNDDTPSDNTSSIRFNLNGGILDGKTGTVTLEIVNGTEITLPEPSREGYTFDYWEGSKYNAGDKYIVKSDHTFAAQWKKDDSADSDEDDNRGKTPKTGAGETLLLWTSMMLMSAAGISVMFFSKKRRDDAR